MKRVFALFGMLILLFSICGCEVHTKTSSNSIAYGDWNTSTKSILATQFEGVLPDEITAQKYLQSHSYQFSQGVLGDPNFVIFVALQMPDEAAYDAYLENCASKAAPVLSQDGIAFYPVQCTSESVADYLDDKVYDGMFFNFEIVLGSRDDLSIRILAAHVWDYYQNEVLVDFLQNLNHSFSNV